MIFFLNNYPEFKKCIKSEKDILLLKLKKQEKLKNIILLNMQDFATGSDEIDVSEVDNVSTYLEKLKHSLQLINDNISSLNPLIESLTNLEKIDVNDTTKIEDKCNSFNKQSYQTIEIIEKNESIIIDCIYIICKNSCFKFPTSIPEKKDPATDNLSQKPKLSSDTNVNISKKEQEEKKEINTLSEEKEENNETSSISENEKNTEIPKYENTLVVSEKEGTVILPYQIATLEDILKKHPKKYTSINDIIQKEYTRPLKNYKNPFISRFKEGFKLIRTTEKGSISDSFSLGLELMFNTNLHPAIITACKNIDELDIYLDYLETGRTDEFDCFKVIFEFPPVVVKK